MLGETKKRNSGAGKNIVKYTNLIWLPSCRWNHSWKSMSVGSCIHFYAVSIKYIDTDVSILLAYTPDTVSFCLETFSVLKELTIGGWHT